MIFNLPTQSFNSYLQTESLFYSFTVLFSCYLLKTQRLTARRIVVIVLFVVLICCTRPTGILFVGCAILYLFLKFAGALSIPVRVVAAIAAGVIFFYILNVALGSGGELDFMLPFRDERIICGVPTLASFRDIAVSENPNSVGGLLYYVTHNTEQFLRLAWWRSKAFFGVGRSYYSSFHNIYLYLYFFPFYLLSILGINQWNKRNRSLLFYCSALIAAHWITVIFSCDDWHNRFFLSVVPYIYILSTPLIKTIADKFTPYDDARDIQT
jgi:hypothetical protein